MIEAEETSRVSLEIKVNFSLNFITNVAHAAAFNKNEVMISKEASCHERITIACFLGTPSIGPVTTHFQYSLF